ncbi:MAG: tetratricopeptide repeat protein [Planctomycetes bacterium]|nr:tetratricopeptide repeat protein [Planctomycetota bacterium]
MSKKKKKQKKKEAQKAVPSRQSDGHERPSGLFPGEAMTDETGEEDFDGFTLPPRGLLELHMEQLYDEMSGTETETKKQARELLQQAFSSPTRAKRIRLARRALDVYPDCADAYIVLSEEAESWEEAYRLCQQAVEAGRRAIGNQYEEMVGEFWSYHPTRPYMRAMFALADCLIMGRRQAAAIELLQEMLRLNPNDNQGVRYRLAALLLEEGQDDELKDLLERYPDEDGTFWNYTRAILAFRQKGDTENARKLLRRALKTNPHVPDYLLDPNDLPSSLPDYIVPGSKEDAELYASNAVSGWRSTPGAIAWLRKNVYERSAEPALREPEQRIADIQPWDALQVPQDPHEVWQFDVKRASEIFPGKRWPKGRWVVLVSSVTEDTVHHIGTLDERPKPSNVWPILLEAIVDPTDREPRRPGRIEMRRKMLWKCWHWRLKTLGIECDLVEDLDHVDRISEVFQERMVAETLRVDSEEDYQRIAELPQEVGAAWQVGVVPLPTWLNDDGEMRRPWSVLVIEAGRGLILHQGIQSEEPSSDFILQTVFQAMLAPSDREPRRPQRILVRNNDHRIALAPHLEKIGVECFMSNSMPELDEAIEGLTQFISEGEDRPALIEIPGIRREQVASFFEAAVQFYQTKPWRRVPSDTVIRITFDDGDHAPWYAVIIGQAGVSLGLAVYDDPEKLRGLFHARDEEVALEQMQALSMNFGEKFELPFADLEAAEQFGWPVAAPEAYPYLFRAAPGYQILSPSLRDVIRMDACLRALPEFIDSNEDCKTISVELPAQKRPLGVTFKWEKDFF